MKKIESDAAKLEIQKQDVLNQVNKFAEDFKDDLKPNITIEKERALKMSEGIKPIQNNFLSYQNGMKSLHDQCKQFVNDNRQYDSCKLNDTSIWSATTEDIKTCGTLWFAINNIRTEITKLDAVAELINKNIK